ncbi:sulfotransferase family protein [Rubellimicrobium aerolatum]|uniref:Sulfotransferase family protein n=1 Tax=Rubellimicrobium aerolatum TaxID=490979 RepID=A0ABW0SCJ3_9RHOB|nr:sulfotransferase [Rubellimicrobium aerolatum]MBP1806162.1 hypothetical protein [Rubellimicrobium aerolatum]
MPPLAIFIGAMKAGTTTTYQMLSEHPEIAASRNKEINFFCRENEGFEALLDQFEPDPSRTRWLLDVSPNYGKKSQHPAAAARIQAYPGNKALFYILRDPVDRVRSHVAHAVKRGRWTVENRDRTLRMMIDISRYAEQIAHYEQAGLRPVLLDFAEISSNPQGFADRITEVLGIGRLACEQAPHRHRSRPVADKFGDAERALSWSLLRDDVRTLASRYGFQPARDWIARWDAIA